MKKTGRRLLAVLLTMLLLSAVMVWPALAETLPDGIYSAGVAYDGSKFVVKSCEITSQNGQMTAFVTMDYAIYYYDYVYPGTPDEARAAGQSSWIAHGTDQNGYYTFSVPITSADSVITLAARYADDAGQSDGGWYAHNLVLTGSPVKTADLPGTAAQEPAPAEETEPAEETAAETEEPAAAEEPAEEVPAEDEIMLISDEAPEENEEPAAEAEEQTEEAETTELTAEPETEDEQKGGLPGIAVIAILVVVVGGLVTLINGVDKKLKKR